METYTGNCLCAGIAFRIVGALAPIRICHCRQCRKAQGAAFAANIPVREEALLFERGRDLIREFESSPGKVRPASHAYVALKANWWPLDDDLPKYPEACE